MGRNSRGTVASALTVLVLLGLAATAGGTNPSDRLERFRQLAASRLSMTRILEADDPGEAYREIYGLLDEEIVESLSSGGVFASIEFLQERLDGFGGAWGGGALRVARLGRFTVATFQLNERAAGNSVRVYGRLGDEYGLVAAFSREGRPLLTPMSPLAGAVQFVVAWEGLPSGWGTRPLRIDLVRQQGDAFRVAWSTADVFPDGLAARTFAVRNGEIRVRYATRYPGWAPGCDGQTELEDVYRLGPGATAFARASQQSHNTWHRELHAVAERLFAALPARDEGALALVVPDAALRARLPATLRREPACDAREGTGPEAVSVAAIADERAPWSLIFRRSGGRWRLTAASPVLQ